MSLRRSAVPTGVLALAAAAAITSAPSCGGAPSNGLVQVANLSGTEATFRWRSPSVLGTAILGGSGTEPIRPCDRYARAFAPGDHQITIVTSSDTESFELAATSAGQRILRLVITPDGTIQETTAAAAPASPYCDE